MKARKTIALHNVSKLDLSYADIPADSLFVRPKGFDPERIPWAIPSNSVEEAQSFYLFNRIPGDKRMDWMHELWRVLVPDGTCMVLVPYWASPRSIQDPFSVWPPLCENSFLYFNKAFRDTNKLPDCGFTFDFTYGYTLDPETAGKSDDTRPFWTKHYINAVHDLQVVLTKK
jgi:hypothetical protein